MLDPELTPVRTASQHPRLVEWVIRTWRDVLSVVAGPDENFFDLGGTAVDAVQVVTKASAELGAELPLGMVFDHPTVPDFAAALHPHVNKAENARQ